MLWPDTFNNHFTPQVAKAAVDVLEHAGYQVQIPPRSLCCGRPLYDYGMLDTAKRMLRDTLDTLREPIRDGVPVVALEPSCTTVFRDELTNLLHGDEDAVRLSKQTFILSEFLKDRVPDYQPPILQRKALVHGHCHHKSELHFEAEVDLLKQAGLECEVPHSGCCGMAGSFGYEADHYQTALACGERVLLPSVRQAAKDIGQVADFDARYQPTLALVKSDVALGKQLQIRSTPTFFINGVKIEGGLPAQYFDQAIAIELQRASAK